MEADKIKVPTLIIWGRHDKSVSWKNGELYHGLFANSTFHIIEKGYHAPFRQEPIEFMEYVQAFFTSFLLYFAISVTVCKSVDSGGTS